MQGEMSKPKAVAFSMRHYRRLEQALVSSGFGRIEGNGGASFDAPTKKDGARVWKTYFRSQIERGGGEMALLTVSVAARNDVPGPGEEGAVSGNSMGEITANLSIGGLGKGAVILPLAFLRKSLTVSGAGVELQMAHYPATAEPLVFMHRGLFREVDRDREALNGRRVGCICEPFAMAPVLDLERLDPERYAMAARKGAEHAARAITMLREDWRCASAADALEVLGKFIRTKSTGLPGTIEAIMNPMRTDAASNAGAVSEQFVAFSQIIRGIGEHNPYREWFSVLHSHMLDSYSKALEHLRKDPEVGTAMELVADR